MKTLWKLLFLLAFTTPVFSQKIRYVGDQSPFLCKGDSIEHYFLEALKRQNVDTIIVALYDFDNGRVERSRRNIFWVNNRTGWVRSFQGCDKVIGDTTRKVDLSKVVAFINGEKFKGLDEPYETEAYISHSMGYLVTVIFPGKDIKINLRDYQWSKVPGKDKVFTDTRVMLVDMLHRLIE